MADVVQMLRTRLKREDALPVHVLIALERTMARLTVVQCARAMGWSHTLWQRVELGARSVSDTEIVKMAVILGVTEARLRGTHATTIPGQTRPGRPAKLAA